ncbi:hypothetical protein Csa_023527, partial [Cucumis sativus]
NPRLLSLSLSLSLTFQLSPTAALSTLLLKLCRRRLQSLVAGERLPQALRRFSLRCCLLFVAGATV